MQPAFFDADAAQTTGFTVGTAVAGCPFWADVGIGPYGRYGTFCHTNWDAQTSGFAVGDAFRIPQFKSSSS
ncbi:MAG: hypothetical protein IKM51_01855, partial [Oscillospiraceae bacterium]|nr:hypothetical protein [Oscillospiraceae bacterium]